MIIRWSFSKTHVFLANEHVVVGLDLLFRHFNYNNSRQRMATPVTQQESIAAFANFLRGAFSSIAYVRGFCDDACFVDATIREGSIMKRLVPASHEAMVLSNWIEEGVLPTFRSGYLSQVTLQAFSPPPQKLLLESYSFSVSYGTSGHPIVDADFVHSYNEFQLPEQFMHMSSQMQDAAAAATVVGGGGPTTTHQRGIPTREQLREQVANMLCDLIDILQSMPPSDSLRCLNMRVSYVDDAVPAEYEARHFLPLSRQQLLFDFSKEKMLSAARRSEGSCSGYHQMQFGLLYRPSRAVSRATIAMHHMEDNGEEEDEGVQANDEHVAADCGGSPNATQDDLGEELDGAAATTRSNPSMILAAR